MSTLTGASTQLEHHRQQFPALANKVYFNFGGQGPLPSSSLAAIQTSYNYIQQYGPFSSQVNKWVIEEANQTRQAIATELLAPVETITLTENVTVGCNIALWGIDWQPGDHLLITDCEHPGVVATAGEIGRRFGVEVSTCPLLATLNQGNSIDIIVQHLKPRTRLVVLSHTLWNTGDVLPLAELVNACHNYSTEGQPLRVLVDGAQSVGVLPLNLTELGVDFYAFTGHKWWCGPEGVGGLYVRPDTLESLNPTFIGWRSMDWSNLVKDNMGRLTGWQPNGQRFEVSTSAYPLYAGLREAIALHQQWGTSQYRYDQICQRSHYLWQRLSQLDSVRCLLTLPPQAGLVSFTFTNGKSCNQVVTSLEQQGLLVRTISHPNCIRASVHYFTDYQEIDQLVEAIASC